jgi:hypothetical protein
MYPLNQPSKNLKLLFRITKFNFSLSPGVDFVCFGRHLEIIICYILWITYLLCRLKLGGRIL